MRAAIRRKYCSPNEIQVEQVEDVHPKENEVLVKVHATAVNRTDCAVLTAKPFIMRFILGLFKPSKPILGTDFSGEVITLGSKVNSLKIGDKVFGFQDTGSESQAEYLTAAEKDVFPIPDNIEFKQAAGSLEGAHYAYSFLHKVKIKAGQNILINGATGGIGSALLQFVKQYDVTITATCNTKNVELIQSLGANKTIDYTKDDFTKHNGKYDFVFDTVGKSTFGKCKSILKKNGVYISSELGPNGQNLFYPFLTMFSKQKVIFPIPFNKQITIPYITELLKTGGFTPVIDREYPLEEISKAYEYVIKGQKTGNVIITIV